MDTSHSPTACLAFEDRILSIRDVTFLTSLSPRQIERLEAGGDFPKRLRLSAARVGWRLSAVEAWLVSCVEVMS